MIKNTKTPKGPWDAKRDAEYLLKAMTHNEANKDNVLTEIFTTRSRKHIQEIKHKFGEMYGQSLESFITAHSTGNFQKILLDLSEERAELKCRYLNRAAAGEKGTEGVIPQILCSASTRDLKRLNVVYQRLFGSELMSLIEPDWPSDYRLLMIEHIKADRPFEGTSENKGWAEAQTLASQGKRNVGFHLGSFIDALTHRSQDQTRLIFRHYEQLAGGPFDSVLKNEFSEEFKQASRAMVRPAPDYYAAILNDVIKAGPYHQQLIRIIATLTKSELKGVNEAYMRQYRRTLHSVFRTSIVEGPYQSLLLDIVPPIV